MSDPDITPEEVELLGVLREALEIADPIPDQVLAAAKGSYAWFGIDAELAALTFDSVESGLVGARSTSTTSTDERQLTFSGAGVEIELMITGRGERRLIGQMVPPAAATIVLETTDGSRETEADELGQFGFDNFEGGLMRLTVVSGATRIKTEWIIL